ANDVRNFGPFQNIIDQYSGLYSNEFCEFDDVEMENRSPNGHKCKLILLTMDFGKDVNGECTEGDHKVLGDLSERDIHPAEHFNSSRILCRS
ncbi:unnamed protein product, partial [Onchocerca ochengi]|uniref:Peptidase M12A domain-containing protein n=1 Tax=Onchocerca ochengi TaxID=42157 RepID=A0A182ESL2_ONCOC